MKDNIRANVMRTALCLAVAVCCVPLFSQSKPDNADSRSVLLLQEAEQEQFVRSYLMNGMPERLGDTFALLLVNRSSLVVPMLESRVELELRSEQRSERSIDLFSALIAYPGDEYSLEAVGNLIRLDESRFGDLVGRTLDNAGNWRNPFTVAYRGFEMDDEGVSGRISAWASSSLASAHGQRAWAEALLDRYGHVLSESEWANDAIASRLKNGASSELRQSLDRFVADAQKRRLQR